MLRPQQVLINLGGNAIKFTSHGEVVLRLRVVEQTAGDVLLEFPVKGIGIAPRGKARPISQRVFAGRSLHHPSLWRYRLGLAISSRLVR